MAYFSGIWPKSASGQNQQESKLHEQDKVESPKRRN